MYVGLLGYAYAGLVAGVMVHEAIFQGKSISQWLWSSVKLIVSYNTDVHVFYSEPQVCVYTLIILQFCIFLLSYNYKFF